MRWTCTVSALLMAGLPTAFAADNSFVVRGATIHPVSSAEIANGSILVRDGKIISVGAQVTAPKGVRVIEGRGLHIYPGIIDSASELGLSEIGSVRETNDTNELGDFNPQLRSLIAINPESEHIPVTRANGITTAISMPSGGILSGQASLIHLDGWTWEDMAVKRSAAMMMHFPLIQTITGNRLEGVNTRTFAEAKRSYEEQVKKIHDFFEQARRYQRAKSAGGPAFHPDLKLEAMLPVLEGKLPVMIVAVREREIKDAIEFADKEKIRIVLAGVRRPGAALALMKSRNIPVVLSGPLALPLEEDDPYDAAAALPGELYKAGIQFAFGSFSTSFSRNLPFEAAHAVGFGLPQPEAVKAVTLNAAQIWGVDDQLGSLEAGKVADLVITDGDLLEARTQIKQLFIAGKPVSLENKHTRLYEKYRNRP